jgi:hypothetical protein
MAALKLVSLVLRGVAVRCDRVNVELRLDAGYKASPGTPEIPFSMRHPSQGYQRETFGNPADRPERILDVGGADSGAGRSLGLAGVLRRSHPTTYVGRTALRQSDGNGANVIVNSNARLSVTTGAKPIQAKLCRSEIGEAWCKPATRTPPASTWGRESR